MVLSISISISRCKLAKQPHSTIQDLNYLPTFLLWHRFVHLHFWGLSLGWMLGLILGFHHFNPSLVSTNFASCYGYLVEGLGFLIHTTSLKILCELSSTLCVWVCTRKFITYGNFLERRFGTLLCFHHATFLLFFWVLKLGNGNLCFFYIYKKIVWWSRSDDHP